MIVLRLPGRPRLRTKLGRAFGSGCEGGLVSQAIRRRTHSSLTDHDPVGGLTFLNAATMRGALIDATLPEVARRT